MGYDNGIGILLNNNEITQGAVKDGITEEICKESAKFYIKPVTICGIVNEQKDNSNSRSFTIFKFKQVTMH